MKGESEENLDLNPTKSFLRYGFRIIGKRTTSKIGGKYWFYFEIFNESTYYSNYDCQASTLKSAKKKLERYMLKNDLILNHPKESYTHILEFNQDNYQVRKHYINNIIKKKGEERYKYCPKCCGKVHSDSSYCYHCNDHQFFKRY